MTLVVQDDTGSIAGANAYITVVAFKAYHDARGTSYTAYADPAITTAIIRATDYLDRRFRYVGERRLGRSQTTQWPRSNARDLDRYYINDIPREVKDATAEYALRALAGDLVDDPDRDATGQKVQSKSEKVGPIEQAVTFVGGAAFVMPVYPMADNLLIQSGLTRAGNEVQRA